MEQNNSFRQVLFGKVDLDTIAASLVLGITPDQHLRHCPGSASSVELADPRTLCLEVGGTGRTDENNFDHHPQKGEANVDLSACAQALERLAKLVRYVDEVDRGLQIDGVGKGKRFPSLVQLMSGMKLVIREPEMQMRRGLEIMRTVLQSGLDPYGCMEKIINWMPEAVGWIETKREHEARFAEVLKAASWFTTSSGHKLAVVETNWIGAPGALYGQGAVAVVVFNPAHRDGGNGTPYRKFTVAVHRESGADLSAVKGELLAREDGWGGPAHGTIIGSPRGTDSNLALQTVTAIVVAHLQKSKVVALRIA